MNIINNSMSSAASAVSQQEQNESAPNENNRALLTYAQKIDGVIKSRHEMIRFIRCGMPYITEFYDLCRCGADLSTLDENTNRTAGDYLRESISYMLKRLEKTKSNQTSPYYRDLVSAQTPILNSVNQLYAHIMELSAARILIIKQISSQVIEQQTSSPSYFDKSVCEIISSYEPPFFTGNG